MACIRREGRTDPQPLVRAASDTSERIVATTVGDEHACAVSSRDVAYCWGKADGWLLGTEDSASAVRVAGNHRFTSVAAGGSFTCAIDVDGQAFCWGRAQKGQLGAGAFFDAAQRPQSVAGEHHFGSVVAGREHACAIDDTGAAWCWGDNTYGQLGDSSTRYASVPVRVLGQKLFLKLGAGAESNSTCGVTNLGQGFCWGYNGSGQLGDGTTRSRNTPVRIKGLTQLRAIDPGADATCALTIAADVYCWGSNAVGQLGLGYAIRDTVMITPSERVRVSEKFASVSAGDKTACAVSVVGRTYCWGSADGSLLGSNADDSCTDRMAKCTRNPVLVHSGARFIQIALGPNDRVCGAGRVPTQAPTYCWGRSFTNPSTSVVDTPALLPPAPLVAVPAQTVAAKR